MNTILFFGDSLTAGYGLKNVQQESFPALIQQKINAEQLPYNVINAGLSGDTSYGGLNRLSYWLSQPIAVFVLELGVNDIMRGVAPPVTVKNLQLILEQVRIKNPAVKIAIMGMELPAFIPGAHAAEFRTIFRKLATDYRAALVPFFLEGVAGIPHLNLPDHLHPSAAGYKVIADKVWPVLKPLLV